MKRFWLSSYVVISAMALPICGQETKPSKPPEAPPQASQPTPAITTTIKKTVAFLTTSCFHDFSQDISHFRGVQNLSIEQRIALTSNLKRMIDNLLSIPKAAVLITPDERAFLVTSAPNAAALPDPQLTLFIQRSLADLKVMTNISDHYCPVRS